MSIWFGPALRLKKEPTSLTPVLQYPETSGISALYTTYLGYDVAKAIKPLHDRNIAHMDLKPSNILIRGERMNSFKVIDLGSALSTAAPDATTTLPIQDWYATTIYTRPPEQFNVKDGKVLDPSFVPSTAMDIYSLGIMMIVMTVRESFNFKEWFEDFMNDNHAGNTNYTKILKWRTLFLDLLSSGKNRLGGSDKAWETLVSLITKMVSLDPEERPTVDDVISTLVDIVAK